MNNRFWQIASLACCMILGTEGILFVNDVVAQTRSLNPPTAQLEKKPPAPTQEAHHVHPVYYRWFICFSDRS